MQQLNFIVDFKTDQIWLFDQRSYVQFCRLRDKYFTNGQFITLPMRKQNDGLVFNIALDDIITLSAIVDTAASHTVINKNLISKFAAVTMSQSSEGLYYMSPQVTASYSYFPKIKFDNETIYFVNMLNDINMLLGMNHLRKNIIIFDNFNKKLSIIRLGLSQTIIFFLVCNNRFYLLICSQYILGRKMERVMRFELTTSTLAR